MFNIELIFAENIAFENVDIKYNNTYVHEKFQDTTNTIF